LNTAINSNNNNNNNNIGGVERDPNNIKKYQGHSVLTIHACNWIFNYVYLSQFQYCQLPDNDSSRSNDGIVQHFYDALIQSIDTMKVWADKVPGFAELCKADQDLLFQSAALELVLLRVAYCSRFVCLFQACLLAIKLFVGDFSVRLNAGLSAMFNSATH
jgi:Ligand-binding domain of nuclear hormone receptor